MVGLGRLPDSSTTTPSNPTTQNIRGFIAPPIGACGPVGCAWQAASATCPAPVIGPLPVDRAPSLHAMPTHRAHGGTAARAGRAGRGGRWWCAGAERLLSADRPLPRAA